MSIAAIVLAAGESKRLGQPKQLLHYHDETLLRRTILAAQDAGCEPVLTVLGASAEQIKSEAEAAGSRVVLNEQWPEGMASSIRCGLSALGEEIEAVILLACDQPLLDTHHLGALIAKWREVPCDFVASEYNSTRGVPTLFDRQLFPELLALQGDRGARSLFRRADLKLEGISWPQGAFDVDTVEDLASLEGDLLKDLPVR